MYPVRSEKWTVHPTEDVAVSPLSLGGQDINDVDVATLGDEDTAPKSQIARMGFYESTPVYMVGFPVGMIEGGKKNYPVVRVGTIAQIQGYLRKAHESVSYRRYLSCWNVELRGPQTSSEHAAGTHRQRGRHGGTGGGPRT